jgi:hypothetical protein
MATRSTDRTMQGNDALNRGLKASTARGPASLLPILLFAEPAEKPSPTYPIDHTNAVADPEDIHRQVGVPNGTLIQWGYSYGVSRVYMPR